MIPVQLGSLYDHRIAEITAQKRANEGKDPVDFEQGSIDDLLKLKANMQ